MKSESNMFVRRVVSEKRDDPLCYEYTLECGHVVVTMVPLESGPHYCAQCLHDWIEQFPRELK